MNRKEINIRDWNKNAVKAIGDDWALVTAGTAEQYNTMTVSWGGVGVIWGKDAAFIFVRHSRYTLEFLEANDRFSISFFPPEYRKALAFCGSKSGRDFDKAKETGLTPVFDGVPFFEEATDVLVCRKMAKYELLPDGFLTDDAAKNYADGDYHRMFIAEIERVLVRED